MPYPAGKKRVPTYGNFRHGAYGTRAYRAWQNMKTRCLNPKNEKFKDYGARGITVCERWLDFAGFLTDMGQPPNGCTIERKDVNGNYDLENCIWLPAGKQAQNKRSGIIVGGVRKTKKQISKELGLHPRTIYERVRRGWPLEKALTVPKGG